MITLKNEPQDKVQIIKQGWQIYQKTLSRIIPFSFMAALFIFLPHFAYSLSSLKSSVANEQSTFVVSMIISWMLALIFITGLILRLYYLCYEVPNSFFKSLKYALLKLIPVLLLTILYSLIILSGTMLLIIPGMILSITLMFSFIILITDNQNILQTLTSSHRLVSGHWRHTTLCMSIPLLLNLTLSSFAVFLFLNLLSLQLNIIAIYVFMFIVNLIIQALLVPLTFSIALVLFHDLKHRQTLQRPSW